MLWLEKSRYDKTASLAQVRSLHPREKLESSFQAANHVLE